MVTSLQDKKYTDKLPWQQVLSLSSANFSQAVMLTTPFTIGVFMVRDFQAARYGGLKDAVDEQVAGIFSFSSFLTAYAWGYASNYIGRKPVIVIGNAVSFVSMLWFGLSGNYGTAAAARVFGGFFNGILGAWKCMIGESTDVLLQGKFFGYMSLAWGLGCIAGPALGGAFSRPCSRLPHLTMCGEGQLLRARPYFLACAVGSLTILGSLLLSVFMLEETLPKSMMDKSLIASLRRRRKLRRRERRRLLQAAEEEDANVDLDFDSESSLDLSSSGAGACLQSPQKAKQQKGSDSGAKGGRRWRYWRRGQEPVAAVLAPGEAVYGDVENGEQPAGGAVNKARTAERTKLLSAHAERSSKHSSCPRCRQPTATGRAPPCSTSAKRQNPGLPPDSDVESDASSETASACSDVVRSSSWSGGPTDTENCNHGRRRHRHRDCGTAASSRTPSMMRLQGLLSLASRTYVGINPFARSLQRRFGSSSSEIAPPRGPVAPTAASAETDIELCRCRKRSCDDNYSCGARGGCGASRENRDWSKGDDIRPGEMERDEVESSCLRTGCVADRRCSGGDYHARAPDEKAAGCTTSAISAAAAPTAANATPEGLGHCMVPSSPPPPLQASGATSEFPDITGTGGIYSKGGVCEEDDTDTAGRINRRSDSSGNGCGGSAPRAALGGSPAGGRRPGASPSQWTAPMVGRDAGNNEGRRAGRTTGLEPTQDVQPEDHLRLTLSASGNSFHASSAAGASGVVNKGGGTSSSGGNLDSGDEAPGSGDSMVDCSLRPAADSPADGPYPHGPSFVAVAVAEPSPGPSRLSNASGEGGERASTSFNRCNCNGRSGCHGGSVSLPALAILPEDSSLHGTMAFPAAERGGGQGGILSVQHGLDKDKQPDERPLAPDGDEMALPGEARDNRHEAEPLQVTVAAVVVEGEEPKRILPWFRYPQVVLTVLGYGATALIFCAIDEVFPIFASAPRMSGGLGMREEQIAPPLMFFGAVLMPYSLYVYPPLQRHVGTLRLTRLGLMASVVTCILIPLVANLWNASAIFAQVFLYFAMVVKAFAQCSAFTGSIIAVNAAPSQEQLGAVNGVGQTLAALVRGVGPALGGLLWAVSLGLHSPGQQFLTFGLIAAVAAANFGLYGFVRLPNMR
ncbi:hypothetical protein Vretifemale_1079 [Volvox reticuliferus]|uniref:Major facilitator superfamily (MFS) profile domain-containing protein n=1 Tax=Volvox reticuliferus TaxID=1737510 RepID=A0A8J4C2P4_9CHLO|nr:hypothetical protein Vretifemale_1079 [Volvox reticuliferus]